ncbi:vascular endothelial growth factor A-like isoform X3 [Hemiscyllium ocellatum]|uniref:vascular endothelial growth factor A-like isoform X3 n=1 Tax=Hemiscyllium ocellatum TaxID=170820 RepID=UPI0029672CAE|nr:vascular endothelial growth factor A-like isoform X3 [Hemiscyllium ocellatum]
MIFVKMDVTSTLTILHWLLALSLRWSSAKTPRYPLQTQQQTNQVMSWMDVYWHSVCQTRETLIAISGEYPNEILKVKHQWSNLVEIPFTQHRRCECRPKKDFKHVTSRTDQSQHRNGRGQQRKLIQAPSRPTHCRPCSHRKRHGFVQNLESCECYCRLTHQRCRLKGQELNEHTCRCEKTRR